MTQINVSYDQVKESIFYEDGSLRDVYIRPTDVAAWETLYAYLIKNFQTRFIVDGEEQKTAPKTAQEVLALRENHAPLLSTFVGPVRINTYFFTEEEFEGDIDPREIKDQNSLDLLLNWMRGVGTAVQKDVLLTPESGVEDILFRFKFSTKSFERQ